ncbi:hypothetical protein D3C72_2288150 [compost metagenome]
MALAALRLRSSAGSMMTMRQLPVPDVWLKNLPARLTSSTVIAPFALPVFSSIGRLRCKRLCEAPEASCRPMAEAGSGSEIASGASAGSGCFRM